MALAAAKYMPSGCSPLPFASRTRRRHPSICHAKHSNSGGGAQEPEKVDPDLVIPPPRQGSQYQTPESSFAYGGNGGGGKGGGFYNLFTGGGSFGEGDEGYRGRRRRGANFAPFNRARLMLLSLGWALSVYLVISSLFKLLRAAAVKSGLTSWMRSANPRSQIQFQDDHRSEEGISEEGGDGEEYEAMQAGGVGALASACAATPGVQSQEVGEGGKEGVASGDVGSSGSGLGEGCGQSAQAGGVLEQRGATNGRGSSSSQQGSAHCAEICSHQSGHASSSGAAAATTSSRPGAGQHIPLDQSEGGTLQGQEVDKKGASADGALSSEQLAHADLLRQYKQRREANVAASISGGRFSSESSLAWHTTCAYCMVLGTVAFFFNVK